jgi:hypothetical protein
MDELVLLLKKELIQLECYLSVSKRLIYEDIYAFAQILSERDEQIKVYKQIIADINETLNNLPVSLDVKLSLRSVIDNTAADAERALYPDIAVFAGEISAVIADIRNTDTASYARAEIMRAEILAQIESTEKTNRVAHYIRQTNFDPSRGAKINTKS